MTDYKSIVAAAISSGLITPPEPVPPVNPKAPKKPRMSLAEIRARGKWPHFEAEKERKRSHICVVPTCGKPAKYSERMGRYIERCEDCARKSLEDSMARAARKKRAAA